MKAGVRIALALGIAGALLVVVRVALLLGVGAAPIWVGTWPFPHVVREDWTPFTSTDWRMPAPEPPPSATPTDAARALLPYRDRIIAARVIAQRPENQKTGGWPQENAPEAIASGVAGAKLQIIADVEPIYRLPAGKASTIPWDAIKPSGAYVVEVARRDVNDIEYFALRRDEKGRWWWSDDSPMPVDVYRERELAQIRRLTGKRHFTSRFIWRSFELSWWLIRFDDGTVQAWPSERSFCPNVIDIAGQRVDQSRLYPASAIFDEVRSHDARF
jgi:hypothetical protein